MRKFTFILVAFLIVWAAGATHARDMVSRPYLKLGYLLMAPSADDLGYENVDGASLEQYIDVNKKNYGFGGQFLWDFLGTASARYRVGLDIGFQKLFSSKFDTGEADQSLIYTNYHEDREYDLYALGVAEYEPARMPVFFQAGLGAHIVLLEWEHNFEGRYGTEYEDDSWTSVNFGLLLAGGTKLALSSKLSMPVMVRIDSVFRHGVETTLSLMIGLDFNSGN